MKETDRNIPSEVFKYLDLANNDFVHFAGNWPAKERERVERVRKEQTREFRNFLDRWLASGRDINWIPKMIEEFNDLMKDVRFRIYLQPFLIGQGGYHPEHRITPKQSAALVFIEFLTGEHAQRLGKCKRCNQYFISPGAYQNIKYCSRKCATHATAIESTKARREHEQAEKVQRTGAAIQRFNGLALAKQKRILSGNSKKWIAKEADVTTRWLTRAISRGRIPALDMCLTRVRRIISKGEKP